MIGVLPLFLITISTAFGQQDPEARRVLDAMSKKYQALDSFTATLVQTLSNTQEGLNETVTGSLAVKGDMFAIDLGAQAIANDGEKVYVYLEEVNEITIDFYYPEEDDLNPSKLFDMYKSGFKYTMLPSETVNGKACHIIDLIPENGAESQFYRIRLAVDKNNLVLQRYTMFDRANTEYVFTLQDVKLNAPLPDSKFRMNTTTHPGATITDFTN